MEDKPKTLPLRLVRPSPKYASSFCEMAEEFYKAGEPRYLPILHLLREDFSAYLDCLNRQENPHTVPPGRVPQSVYWLVDRERQIVLGEIRLRHALNPSLEKIGGHIGYAIRPSERCKGFGTRMLAMLIERLKNAGWERVLLTCDADNLASERIMQSNGAYLENQHLDENTGKRINRYWIDLNRSSHVSK